MHDRLGAWDGSSRYIVDVAELFLLHGHEVVLVSRQCERALPPGLQRLRPEQLTPVDLVYGSDLALLREVQHLAKRFFYAPLDALAADAALERWALEACDRVLRFTPAALSLLERTYDMCLKSKALLAVYVSRAFEDSPRPEFQRPRPAQLLWVGRLIPSKDVAFLLRAVARLSSSAWTLRVVGDGPCRAELELQCAQLGIAAEVQFEGHLADVAECFRSASVFLTASRSEHYSLTLLEAAAHGVPCIGLQPDGESIINACPEQIVAGHTGYIVRDEDEMARRVEQLLTDEATRRVLAENAWSRKQREFPLEAFWKALESAVESALG